MIRSPLAAPYLAAAALAACATPAPARRAAAPPHTQAAAEAAATPVPATPAPDLFASAVRPVLARRCTPCHEPGGRMYERLPFDSPQVVAGHRAGVLRRIKDPDDLRALEGWLATLPPG
jgi:hypothetical protein